MNIQQPQDRRWILEERRRLLAIAHQELRMARLHVQALEQRAQDYRLKLERLEDAMGPASLP